MLIYCVYDTIKKSYWEGPKKKRAWSSIAAAKNAWNYHTAHCHTHYEVVFSQQRVMVIHEITVDSETAREV